MSISGRSSAQLRIIDTAPARKDDALDLAAMRQSADPVRRVFAHWADAFGKSLRRCKLTPERNAAVVKALHLYGEDMLLEAIDGASADAWLAEHPDVADLAWIVREGARIERYADAGLVLREQAEQEAQREAARSQARLRAVSGAGDEAPGADGGASAADVAAARERVKAMAARMRGAA